ncbi:sugar ABC transporter ATP-binding protein [Gelria sp. Kuro-4]|uniref:sugar ABC transporter ATP-binding protein n=1 Tax=Gelria sp. Kuro-4 TaxID=2796927 RepID=UPI001BF02799|nr:sugar ABC transporter ATP-binding protein [Gelria sp. Kuro-4]BCV24591.1 ribose import ATP-binding protein RbsA [Gelria sp. Kuro-4]
MNETLLELREINKSFSGVQVLKNVTFTVAKGEVHALVGENGAGKSTLMKILSGAYTRDSGEILLNGQPVDIRGPGDARRLGISIIYQELSLVPQLNAVENIFLGRWPEKSKGLVDWSKLWNDAARLLQDIGVSINTKVPVRELSVGQRQMIEIVRALSCQAKIIVMDEPTSALTEKEIQSLLNLIRELKRQGVTIIYISHRLDEVFTIADRVTVLKDGAVTGTRAVSQITKAELIRLMVGRDIKDFYPKRTSKPGEVVLEVKNLTHKGVIEDVSFQVRAGEIVCLAGLIGAGRTETVRALFGADPVDSGEVYILGNKVRMRTPAEAIRAGIALAPEDRRFQGLVQCLSVGENITLANLQSVASRRGVINLGLEKTKVKGYIKDLNIRTQGPQQKVQGLSGGNQQKVVLAKWLDTRARIFIFDEPTRGIDVGSKVEIYQLMNKLAESGAAVIVVSSELPEVLGISDRILVMHQGRIAGELMACDATEEEIMGYAVGGVE